MLSDVWRQADSASTNLGQLPYHISLNKTSKFLSQLSDYCRYLTIKAGEGRPLTLEEMKNLKELKNSSIRLNNELKDLESRVNKGEVTWKELRDMSNEKPGRSITGFDKQAIYQDRGNLHRIPHPHI